MKNSSTVAEFRKDLCLSLANLRKSQKAIGKKDTVRNATHNQCVRIQRLETALIAVQEILLDFMNHDNTGSQGLPSGYCRKHPRLGLITWETADVPCPVCERNDFVDSQLAELEKQLGHKEHMPMWDAYYNLWDLPPLERKRRASEFAKVVKDFIERKKSQTSEKL